METCGFCTLLPSVRQAYSRFQNWSVAHKLPDQPATTMSVVSKVAGLQPPMHCRCTCLISRLAVCRERTCRYGSDREASSTSSSAQWILRGCLCRPLPDCAFSIEDPNHVCKLETRVLPSTPDQQICGELVQSLVYHMLYTLTQNGAAPCRWLIAVTC